MSDLIDREEAIRIASGYCHPANIAKELEKLPTIEIIRCKDCIYGEQDEEGQWYCRDLDCQMGNKDGTGFCSDAERREDE